MKEDKEHIISSNEAHLLSESDLAKGQYTGRTS